jgi:3',5'-cyclic AMP phosphodiesterase CpdA
MDPRTKLNRRQMLRLSAGTLLGAGLWPGILSAGEKQAEEFHFLVVNDVHYLDSGCGTWLEGVMQQMKGHKQKIDFCLMLGDLAENGLPAQLAPVHDLFKKLDLPTYFVVGNHDYRTQEDRKAFEDLFPRFINYQFEHRGWQFLGLDTTEGLRSRNTSVQAPTLRWLDDSIPKCDKKRPTIVFTHFPLGPWVIGRPKNAVPVLERFKEINLQAVFSGHWHGFTERRVGQVTLTTDRCCSFRRQNHDGTKEKGYFLCHAKDGRVERAFVEVKHS